MLNPVDADARGKRVRLFIICLSVWLGLLGTNGTRTKLSYTHVRDRLSLFSLREGVMETLLTSRMKHGWQALLESGSNFKPVETRLVPVCLSLFSTRSLDQYAKKRPRLI